jgi:hypothetical protein
VVWKKIIWGWQPLIWSAFEYGFLVTQHLLRIDEPVAIKTEFGWVCSTDKSPPSSDSSQIQGDWRDSVKLTANVCIHDRQWYPGNRDECVQPLFVNETALHLCTACDWDSPTSGFLGKSFWLGVRVICIEELLNRTFFQRQMMNLLR